jgi:hypothetical protein
MKRVVAMIVLGIGGLAAAIALTVGALALAGDVGTITQPRLEGSSSPSTSPSDSRDDVRTETPSPSVDDHGRGPDDPAGSEDNSGSGSGSSGSGSSGSGSDGSGSGSDDSGTHSGDDD